MTSLCWKTSPTLSMDFRQDLSKPFQAPYQPSVAHYTDYYVLLISGSKAFSYAGQRIGVSCISDKLYHRAYPELTQRYGGGTFGTVFIHRVLYALSSGTSHSAQYALAAMLKAANEDQYNFLDEVKVYGERARRLKESSCATVSTWYTTMIWVIPLPTVSISPSVTRA